MKWVKQMIVLFVVAYEVVVVVVNVVGMDWMKDVRNGR